MSSTPEGTPEEPREEEISLRSLSEAFAEALARQRVGSEPAQAGADSDEEAVSADADTQLGKDAAERAAAEVGPPPVEDVKTSEEHDSCPVNPRTILEAMLFVGDPENRPLESARAASLMRDGEPGDIPGLVDELNESYRQRGCPYRIASDGAGFRLTLEETYDRLRDKFYGRIRLARLSQAAIDVLAIVAYRQPLAADEVSRLRDKPSYQVLSQLVRRRLLRIERPAEKPRKPLYYTTDRFLELFELSSLADLPESEALDRAQTAPKTETLP